MKTGVLMLVLNACVLLRGVAVENAVQPGAKTQTHETESRVITFNDGNGAGPYAGVVPDFKLKDCSGQNHNSESLFKERGTLLMVTVPNLTQYERQKKWEKYIKQAGWPQENAPKCVVIEDLSQQPGHRDKAFRCMQDKAREESRELFLVDESGDVRRALGVDQNETVILIVDSSGSVVHHEADEVEPNQESAQRVARYIRKLAEAARTIAIAVAAAKTDTQAK